MATPENQEAESLGALQPPRPVRASRFDSQGVNVTWKSEEEKGKAKKTLAVLETAYSSIIQALDDPNPGREGLTKTPLRAAKALLYFTKGYEDDLNSE